MSAQSTAMHPRPPRKPRRVHSYLRASGHSPWRSDVQEVAQVAGGAYRKRECGVDTPSPAAPRSSDINWTVTCVDDGSKFAAHEVRLHSGEWHVVQLSPAR